MSNLYRGPSKYASYQVLVYLAKRFQRRRKNNCLWWPCLLTDRDEMSNLYRGPSIDASYQVLVHLAKPFERRRKNNCLWWPCLLTDRDEMSNLYRGPSIDASYQVLVLLAKPFQSRPFFLYRPIRNKNCLWWLCLLMVRDEMSNLYREPSIDASYQVSVHLARRFQRRRFF
jgi:hypothetical protein